MTVDPGGNKEIASLNGLFGGSLDLYAIRVCQRKHELFQVLCMFCHIMPES